MLRKAVYGLKEATRVWYEKVVRVVTKMGGRRSKLELTLCGEKEGESLVL